MAKAISATPIGIIESYFGVKLGKGGLKDLDRVTGEGWFDFGELYLKVMQLQFLPKFLDAPDDDESARRYGCPIYRGRYVQSSSTGETTADVT